MRLNSHNLDAIQAEIQRIQEDGHWVEINKPCMAVIKLGEGNIPIPGLSWIKIPLISIARNQFRSFNSIKLFEKAAWQWLTAIKPLKKLNDLSSIRKECYLDHLPEGEFLSKLQQTLKSLQRKHSSIESWILRRIALLDFKIDPPLRSHTKEYAVYLMNANVE